MDDSSRDRAHAALKKHFERNTSPRSILSFIVAVTGGAGFVASWAMLKLGETDMSIRYPIAVFIAYGSFLGMLRVWAECERQRTNLDVKDLCVPRREEPVRDFPKTSRWPWLDFLDIPDFSGADEGCLIGCVALIAAGVIVGAVAAFISSAPALISDVFLDAVLMTALYKRHNRAARQHWLGTAIRRTWIAALMTALVLYILGAGIEFQYPNAKSIGDLWRMPSVQK